jgi:hypothetical protein
MGLLFFLIWESVARMCLHLRRLHPRSHLHRLQKLIVKSRDTFLIRM